LASTWGYSLRRSVTKSTAGSSGSATENMSSNFGWSCKKQDFKLAFKSLSIPLRGLSSVTGSKSSFFLDEGLLYVFEGLRRPQSLLWQHKGWLVKSYFQE
jgi:hypothetical protein